LRYIAARLTISGMAAQTSAATERALRLVLKGWTPYAAAKKEGIALSTIYRALKREKERK
jgi:transposase